MYFVGRQLKMANPQEESTLYSKEELNNYNEMATNWLKDDGCRNIFKEEFLPYLANTLDKWLATRDCCAELKNYAHEGFIKYLEHKHNEILKLLHESK